MKWYPMEKYKDNAVLKIIFNFNNYQWHEQELTTETNQNWNGYFDNFQHHSQIDENAHQNTYDELENNDIDLLESIDQTVWTDNNYVVLHTFTAIIQCH